MDLRGGTTVAGFPVWHAGNMGANSGLSADSVRGIFLDTTATATTIVQRDSNGDIYALGAKLGNIQVGYTTDNKIDTSSGNLILDSAGGTVQVDDVLNVTSGGIIVKGTSLNAVIWVRTFTFMGA